MKIKHLRDAPTRVYRYGLIPLWEKCQYGQPPTGDEALVRKTLLLAHKYRNDLVQIERGKRTALRAIIAAHPKPGYAHLYAAIASADEGVKTALAALKAERARLRTRKVAPEFIEAVNVAKAVKKKAINVLRAKEDLDKKAGIEYKLDPAVSAEMNAISAAANDLWKNARAYSGVYWGTYLLVEKACMQSFDLKQTPFYDDPKFKRFEGEGGLGVQLQGGLDAADVFGKDTQLQIAPVDERAWHSESRGERRKLARTKLKFRVDSTERTLSTATTKRGKPIWLPKGRPIWVEWNMVMHRPLPEGTTIKDAAIHCRKRGPREEWSLTITVEGCEKKSIAHAASGAVAIDLGWRKFSDGIRVTRWRGTDGECGELRLDTEMVNALTKADSLQSIRDRNFDVMIDGLRKWLASHEIPEWLRHIKAHLHQWESQRRLNGLLWRWKTDKIVDGVKVGGRFNGDGEIIKSLEAWAKQDRHLWEWEEAQRIKAQRRRRERYRLFAVEMSKRYQTLVLEDFDLRKVAKRAPVEEEKGENEVARHNRQLMAVSDLRLWLVNAFGSRAVKVPPENTTRTCCVCTNVEKFDAAAKVTYTCGKCGALWDQDDNACINLLVRYDDLNEKGAHEAYKVKESGRTRMLRGKAAKQARARAAAVPSETKRKAARRRIIPQSSTRNAWAPSGRAAMPARRLRVRDAV